MSSKWLPLALATLTMVVVGCNSKPTPPQTYQDTKAGVEYTTPAGWKKEGDGQIVSPDEQVVITMAYPDQLDQSPEGIKSITAGMEKTMTNLKTETPLSSRSSNGLSVVSCGGTATAKGVNCDWGLVTFQGSAKPVIWLEIAGRKGELTTYQKDLESLISSVKPLPGSQPVASATPIPPPAATPEASPTPEASAATEETPAESPAAEETPAE